MRSAGQALRRGGQQDLRRPQAPGHEQRGMMALQELHRSGQSTATRIARAAARATAGSAPARRATPAMRVAPDRQTVHRQTAACRPARSSRAAPATFHARGVSDCASGAGARPGRAAAVAAGANVAGEGRRHRDRHLPRGHERLKHGHQQRTGGRGCEHPVADGCGASAQEQGVRRAPRRSRPTPAGRCRAAAWSWLLLLGPGDQLGDAIQLVWDSRAPSPPSSAATAFSAEPSKNVSTRCRGPTCGPRAAAPPACRRSGGHPPRGGRAPFLRAPAAASAPSSSAARREGPRSPPRPWRGPGGRGCP